MMFDWRACGEMVNSRLFGGEGGGFFKETDVCVDELSVRPQLQLQLHPPQSINDPLSRSQLWHTTKIELTHAYRETQR